MPRTFPLIFDGGAASKDTDLLPADIEPERREAIRLSVSLGSRAGLYAVAKRGGTEVSMDLREGSDLQAGSVYTFTFSVDPSISYNFRTTRDVDSVPYFLAEGIRGMVL